MKMKICLVFNIAFFIQSVFVLISCILYTKKCFRCVRVDVSCLKQCTARQVFVIPKLTGVSSVCCVTCVGVFIVEIDFCRCKDMGGVAHTGH